MQKKSTKIVKVPEGKLLRIDILSDRENILEITISGDFFMHPEKSISLFENKIKGLPLKFEIEKLQRTLDKIVEENKIEIIGISTKDIVRTLQEAIDQ